MIGERAVECVSDESGLTNQIDTVCIVEQNVPWMEPVITQAPSKIREDVNYLREIQLPIKTDVERPKMGKPFRQSFLAGVSETTLNIDDFLIEL
jgi:hypothetical protein